MNSELAKLIYDLKWDEKAAFNVYNIRKQLTASWFEYYISFFFEKKLWYKMRIPSKVYAADGWIDIKWVRKNKEGIMEYCIIQCKKHKWTTFWINDIRSFVWGVFHILYDFPTTKAYYESDLLMDFSKELGMGWGKDFNEGTVAQATVDGMVKSLPYEVAITPVWYNMDLLKKAGV